MNAVLFREFHKSATVNRLSNQNSVTVIKLTEY
jgi:hypothetical protein